MAAALLGGCGGGEAPSGAGALAPTASSSRERIQSVPPGLAIPADAGSRGMFGPVRPWPLIAVHGVVLPDGRVMSYGTRENGQQTGYFVYDLWDPLTDRHDTLPNTTATDLFCSSQLVLPAGDAVMLAGGDNWTGTGTTNTGNRNSTLLDIGNNALTRGADMQRSRWYSTSTVLLNGEVYIQGGSGGTDFPEIRGIDGRFRLLTGAGTSAFDFMYPRNFVAPDGRVFGYDSAGRMYYVDTSGTGRVTTVGQFGSATAGNDSSAAMFAPGRILQYGGNSNQAIVIDIGAAGTPTVTPTGAMSTQRRLSTAVVMADGRVVATGGSRVWNQLTDVSYHAEIWDPRTGQWTVGASAVRARLYHGNALLLPDASVLVFGGGAPGPQVNTNAEVYYPPYLFTSSGTAAARPSITRAPTVVDTGRTVAVEVDGTRPIRRVTFVKTGSATHGWNMDQRFVELPFSTQGSTLSVQVPSRASDVPPGMWMMFVIDDAGVPSVARMVRVNVAGAMNVSTQPVLATPAERTSVAFQPAELALAASDPNGDPLRFSASGLPPGLSIGPDDGRITGTPQVPGTYTVVVAASDGYNSTSATFAWTVSAPAAVLLDPLPPPAPVAVGGSVTYRANAAGTGLRYRWDFGDGTAPTTWSSSPEVSKSFARPGWFYVTVTVADAAGTERRDTIVQSVHAPLLAGRPLSSSALLLDEPGGTLSRVWVVNPDNGSVSVFDAVGRSRLAEIPVGPSPRALARAADGTVWVTVRDAATIAVIQPSTLAVVRTIALPRASRPHGIVMTQAGTAALVALEATGQVARLATADGRITGLLAVGPNPRHLAVAADGLTTYVSRFITPPLPGESTVAVQTVRNGQPAGGEVVVVDAASLSVQRTLVLAHDDRPDAENQGRGVPNYLGAAALSPDGTQAFVPAKQDNILRGLQRDGLPLNFQNTVRAVSARIDLARGADDRAARVDHDNASVASAAAFDPLGVLLFVALETSREVEVLDAHSRVPLMRIDVGRAPQDVAVSSDRRTLVVHNFMDRSIGLHDLTPLVQRGIADAPPSATLRTVATERLAPQVLAGKQLFYDARDVRLARDRYMSCASCHNDGGHDGRTWDFSGQGEGLRNTTALSGRAGAHGRLHWSNNFDEVQDFEGQIRGFSGGTGLMSDAAFATGTRSQPLGDRKAGVSADLDALAAYVASLDTFAPSPHRPAAALPSGSALEGRAVFRAMNCASCHGGAPFTRSAVDNPADIGTLKPSSGSRLGGALTGIDVPTLRDVWATAPYLHDGSAATLEQAVAAHRGVSVGPTDMGRLVAYLREIGGEEPAPGAGLLGQYFVGTQLAGAPWMSRLEAVDHEWRGGTPGGGGPADGFSVRWTGTLVVPATGSYVFSTVSDDGVRLWLDGSLRISNWRDHAATTNASPTLSLRAGQRVAVRLEYYENRGQATMRLLWRPPGASSAVPVPLAVLAAP